VEISDPEIYQVESVISAPTARYGELESEHLSNTTLHYTMLDAITSHHVNDYMLDATHTWILHDITSHHITAHHIT
jgi:hypothetical protein